MAQSHTRRNTIPGTPGITRSGTVMHWLGMLAMVIGLFAPLATVDAATTVMTPEQALMKAAQQPFDRDTSDFQRVVLVGDFQQQFGCGNWDTNCDQTRLQNINGFWTGAFGVPPGSWSWELVAVDRNGTEFSIDNGQIGVADGQTGVYADFNSATRDSSVSVIDSIAYASGMFGDIALAQSGDGFVAPALNIGNDGWVDMQVTVNGESVQTGGSFQQGVSRVSFDAFGNVTNVEYRGFSEVTVQRTDADGNPLSGSCFVLDGASQSRGCDSDGSGDGSGDGNTTLRFPGGFQPGTYTLRETRAADGAEQLADQQVDVQPGQSTIQARSEGDPTPVTGDLVVLRQDENGAPVGGACFEIINQNGEVTSSACDEDGDVADDGRIGILGVPAGDYTLSETRTPQGYEPAQDTFVTIWPNEVTEQPVSSAAQPSDDPDPIETEEPTEEVTEEPTEEATEEPTEEATQPPVTGRIIVYRQDDVGNPVGGSCFEVLDGSGQIVGDACDEDGIAADDGTTGIENVPVGDYTMVESRVPEGYQQAPDTQVTVTEGDVIYTVVAPAIPATEEPTEEATEEPTEEATEEPTEEATQPPVTGRIIVYRQDDAGNPVGGSCFEVVDTNQNVVGDACDEDGIAADDGTTGIENVPVGDYTMVESRVPEGYERAPDTQVTVTEGDVIYTVAAPAVGIPTEEPTEEATEEPTEEATETPEGAVLLVTYDVDESAPLACIELDTTGAIGMMELPYACDNGVNDANPDAGTIEMQSLDSGEFVVAPFEGPASVVQADPQPVSLVEGQTVSISFESDEPVTTSFTVQTMDGENPVGGACYILDESQELCDDGSGTVTFSDVTPGDHTVRMTAAPEGYNLADPDTQSVAVASDGSTSVSFTLARSTTSFTVQTTDGTNPVGGACYILDELGEPVCDDGSGTVTFSSVTPGDHTVRMTSAPDGYNVPDPDTQNVAVAGDGSTSVSFTVARSTTSFTVQTTDGENPVGGACYILDESQETCDDGSGTVTFSNVTPGDHTVRMTSAPDGYSVPEPASQPVTVAVDGTTSVSFTVARSTTSFTVQTTDGENPVGGACYILDESQELCDEGSGTVTFSDVAPGDHTVRMTSAPGGYNIADPDTQTVSVSGDGSTSISFTVTLVTVDIVITTVDGDTGEALGGACYTLDGGEISCDEQNSGQVVFQGETVGEKTLSMETAPEGFEPSADQVIPADVNSIEVGLFQETGTVVVNITDGTDPVGGACVLLDSGDPNNPICDTDGLGSITIPDVGVGERTVTIVSAPSGWDLPAEDARTQPVVVDGETDGQVTFTLTETPPATGNIAVTVQYSDTEPVLDACVTLTHGVSGDSFSACDTDDGGSQDGIVDLADLPEGQYVVHLQEGFQPDRDVEPGAQGSATVTAGADNTAELMLTLLPTTGTLQISVAAYDAPVSGACFTVAGTTVCDGQDGDTDGTPGVVVITGLEPAGDLLVTMSTVPDGYQAPANQMVEIEAGETTIIEFNLEAEVEPGSVTVRTIDGNGDPLTNACYRLVQGSTSYGPVCDSDPADGEVTFAAVPAGTYRLDQTRKPGTQFQTAPSQDVVVAAGENTTVEIRMDMRPGQLRITTLDRDDQSIVLQGACYVLVGNAEFGPFCDSDDGNLDGIVRFTNIPAGTYTLRQTVATAGYEPAANREVVIEAGGSRQITVLNSRVQPPVESGTLVVIPLAPNGEAVPGGCYQVFNGDTPVTHRVCDNADDQPARITFQNLPVGELTLRETLAPSPDWQLAADISVTIRNGETTTVEVPHEYKRGHVVIQAVNSVGLPLQGACFTLTNAGDTELCTDATGQATVSGLAPGTRELRQTRAPFGFRLNETPREVIVRPGQTTTVRVVFESQPPPNTGTVQIQKFFCPAGEAGERTVFLGGAQGNQELKQTVGCSPGVASFTLVAEDGSTESNAEFKTNAEGRAQLTAVNGIYLLTETDPDLPGNSAARLRVGTGQMTTVIVINYVAPPAPAPVTINVEGYTCPPGFNGSSFVDFQNSCMAESQLTNQISVRAESGNRYKRVTGDTGVRGKTSFVDLQAGTYSIWAERPNTVPVSYLFCGADVNNPTLKAVNGPVSVSLESGSTILCRVFQLTPLFDAEHGAIQVHKFNCPINERQRGYDYQNECGRPTEPVSFEIVQVDAKTRGAIGQPVRVSTNGDGIVQFPMLVPGTYKLTEVEGEWCFAQSNSVDAQGDVVVQKDKLSEVWVYNCVGTKSPPNTGSGDAAGVFGADGDIGPMQVLPNLLWPTVVLAGWLILRERKQA